eukprot:2121945-Pyramimonas_sp.AAC.1
MGGEGVRVCGGAQSRPPAAPGNGRARLSSGRVCCGRRRQSARPPAACPPVGAPAPPPRRSARFARTAPCSAAPPARPPRPAIAKGTHAG